MGKEGEGFKGEPTRADLKEYTRSELGEERAVAANEIRGIRREYFAQKGDLSTKFEAYVEQISSKQEELDVLVSELRILEEEINEISSSLFSKVFEYAKLRKLREDIIEKTEDKAILEKDIGDFLIIRDEITEQLNDKSKLNFARARLEEFYAGSVDDWKAYTERKRVEEFKRLEQEEKERRVENLSAQHGAFFVHGIIEGYSPPTNSLLQSGAKFEHKVKLALSLEPTISASAIQEGDEEGSMWSNVGLLLSEGRVEAASETDANTQARVGGQRSYGFAQSSVKEIHEAVPGKGSSQYNEFLISGIKVAGLYFSEENIIRRSLPISRERVFSLGRELNLPVFYIHQGEVFVSEPSNEAKVRIGERVEPNQILNLTKTISSEDKEKMLDEVLREDMPFRVERIVPEARYVTAMVYGSKQFLEISGDETVQGGGQEVALESLGIIGEGNKDYDGNPKVKNRKVTLIKELKYPSGKIERIFSAGGKTYIQKWDFQRRTCNGSFSEIRASSLTAGYIEDGYNTEDLGRELKTPDDYIEGMRLKLEEWRNKMELSNQDEKIRVFYKDVIVRLSFHLYGFARAASEFGLEDVKTRALEVLSGFSDVKFFEDLIQRRVAKDGSFRFSKEDLGR